MKQKEKIEAREAELNAITVRIEDTETFVNEITETAFEKAIEAVTKTVQEEVRNEDFEIIADQRREVLSDPELGEKQKHFAGKLFAKLMERFRGMTKRITERLAAIFRSPEKREEIQEPIRESIREVLARSRAEADALNAARQHEPDYVTQRRQKNKDR